MDKYRIVHIDQCVTWSNNPSLRTSDTQLWREFVEHVRRYGQLQPIVVTLEYDGRYRVVDGHRRLMALREAGYTSVEVQVTQLSFEAAIEAYGQAEQLKLGWIGRQLGQIVRCLGYSIARAMLRHRHRAILDKSYGMIHDPELIESALERWGTRALAQALRFVDVDEGWPLDRVINAMLKRRRIRDLEDRLKGLRGLERLHAGHQLLAEWEKEEEKEKKKGHKAA